MQFARICTGLKTVSSWHQMACSQLTCNDQKCNKMLFLWIYINSSSKRNTLRRAQLYCLSFVNAHTAAQNQYIEYKFDNIYVFVMPVVTLCYVQKCELSYNVLGMTQNLHSHGHTQWMYTSFHKIGTGDPFIFMLQLFQMLVNFSKDYVTVFGRKFSCTRYDSNLHFRKCFL